jgi:hypothetical protein
MVSDPFQTIDGKEELNSHVSFSAIPFNYLHETIEVILIKSVNLVFQDDNIFCAFNIGMGV